MVLNLAILVSNQPYSLPFFENQKRPKQILQNAVTEGAEELLWKGHINSDLYVKNAQADKMIVMSTTKVSEYICIDLVIWI